MSYGGSEGACQSSGIEAFYDVTVSPDGRSAYVTSVRDGAIAQFDRDTASGALTQKPGIAVGGGVSEVVVSPDGRNVYAAVPELGTVATLDRDATGALTPRTGAAGCVSETGSAGGCQDGRGLVGVCGIAVSPDGRNVYTAAMREQRDRRLRPCSAGDAGDSAAGRPARADRVALLAVAEALARRRAARACGSRSPSRPTCGS